MMDIRYRKLHVDICVFKKNKILENYNESFRTTAIILIKNFREINSMSYLILDGTIINYT